MSWTITPQTKVPVDPVFNNVSLLLHGNGTNGSTTITDNSPTPKTVTAFGNAQISTAQSKFGGASIAFDGTSTTAVKTNTSADFNLSSNNWTIEGFVYPTTMSGDNRVWLNVFQSITDKIVIATISADSNKLYAIIDGTVAIAGTSAPTLNAWNHFAYSKNSATSTLYLNGASIGTTTIVPTSSNKLVELGTDANAARFIGYIDDLRITKGVARYTANFTPPAASFPDI